MITVDEMIGFENRIKQLKASGLMEIGLVLETSRGIHNTEMGSKSAEKP